MTAFLNYLKSLFSKHPTVDGVVVAFHRAIADLEDVITHHRSQAISKTDQIATLHDEVDGHADEAHRATVVVDKLQDLIGV